MYVSKMCQTWQMYLYCQTSVHTSRSFSGGLITVECSPKFVYPSPLSQKIRANKKPSICHRPHQPNQPSLRLCARLNSSCHPKCARLWKPSEHEISVMKVSWNLVFSGVCPSPYTSQCALQWFFAVARLNLYKWLCMVAYHDLPECISSCALRRVWTPTLAPITAPRREDPLMAPVLRGLRGLDLWVPGVKFSIDPESGPIPGLCSIFLCPPGWEPIAGPLQHAAVQHPLRIKAPTGCTGMDLFLQI